VVEQIFTPPTQRALRNEVYDALRRALVTGVLLSGQRINEAKIARQMQISRAPIREAIRQLEQEGLLVSVPRRGTFVVSLSQADVDEVYTLRADIESRAVRRALPRMTSEHFASLEQLVEKMRSTAVDSNLPELLAADIEFHRTIVESANWPRLLKIWESLHPQTLTLYTVSTLTDWTPLDHARRHEPLLAALRSGQEDVAADAMRDHILEVCAQVIRRLSKSMNRD
jgi:DNA-binding GntR family transcriptional regulator